MGRKLVLFMVVAALPASVAVGQAKFFDNKAAFDAAVNAAGLKLVGCDDFEEGNIQPMGVCTLNNPLETGVPNTPTGCGYPTGLDLADQRLAPTGQPPDDNMIGLGAGVIRNPSTVVGPNTWVEELDMHFDKAPEELAVSMKVFTNGSQVKLDCYDANNNQIGTGTVSAGGGGTFVGFVSTDVIGRIHVADPGGMGELVDDVCIYTGGGEADNCLYKVKKIRLKRGCKDSGYHKGNLLCGDECSSKQDCKKKKKIKGKCDEGGKFKVIAKLEGCENCGDKPNCQCNQKHRNDDCTNGTCTGGKVCITNIDCGPKRDKICTQLCAP